METAVLRNNKNETLYAVIWVGKYGQTITDYLFSKSRSDAIWQWGLSHTPEQKCRFIDCAPAVGANKLNEKTGTVTFTG